MLFLIVDNLQVNIPVNKIIIWMDCKELNIVLSCLWCSEFNILTSMNIVIIIFGIFRGRGIKCTYQYYEFLSWLTSARLESGNGVYVEYTCITGSSPLRKLPTIRPKLEICVSFDEKENVLVKFNSNCLKSFKSVIILWIITVSVIEKELSKYMYLFLQIMYIDHYVDSFL